MNRDRLGERCKGDPSHACNDCTHVGGASAVQDRFHGSILFSAVQGVFFNIEENSAPPDTSVPTAVDARHKVAASWTVFDLGHDDMVLQDVSNGD